MPKTGFVPSKNGYLFHNSFNYSFTFLGKDIYSAQFGYCGGMSFSAVDHFFRNDILTRQTNIPDEGESLYKEILGRQEDSLLKGSIWWKIFNWQQRPSTGHWHNPYHSMEFLVRRDEWPNVKQHIDKKQPVVLVLIRKEGPNPLVLTENHQVVAYEYIVLNDTTVRIMIYDPNYPGNDNIYLEFSTNGGWSIFQNGTTLDANDVPLPLPLRGFFVNGYDKSIQSSEWVDAKKMTECNGKIYVAQGTMIYGINPLDNSSFPVGNEGDWPAVRAMTSYNGNLLVVDNSGGGRLWKINPNDGSFVPLSANYEWPDVRGIASLGDSLYIIDGGNGGILWQINPADGSFHQIGPNGDWPEVLGMVGNGGHLYVIDNGNGGVLWQVDVNTGNAEQKGPDYDWPNTMGMASYGNLIYAIANGGLYKINPVDCTYTDISYDTVWGNNVQCFGASGDQVFIIQDGALFSVDSKEGEWKRLNL